MPTIFVISFNEERQKALDFEYTLYEAKRYEDAPRWIMKNFYVKYNEQKKDPESKKGYVEMNYDEESNRWTSFPDGNCRVKSRIGCFTAHISLLEKIAEEQIDDVIVLEDDAHIDREQGVNIDNEGNIDTSNFPQDGACLLSGIIRHPTRFQKDLKFIKEELPNILESFVKGVNTIDYDRYRWSHQLAIYYPNHKVVKELLEKIKSEKNCRYTGVDIYFSKKKFIKYLHYPSLFTGNDAIDGNRNPIKSKSQIGKGEGIIRNYQKLGKTQKVIKENTPPRFNR